MRIMKTEVACTVRAMRAKRQRRVVVGVAMALLMNASLISGCATNRQRGDLQGASDATAISPEQCENGAAIHSAALHGVDEYSYIIQPGDELAIDFYLNPEFNDQVSVSPDGKITLRLIGAVQAGGITPPQLRAVDRPKISERAAITRRGGARQEHAVAPGICARPSE